MLGMYLEFASMNLQKKNKVDCLFCLPKDAKVWLLLYRCLFYNMCKHDIPMLSRSVVHDLMLVNFKFQELGLLPGTPVGTSLIDAHAGGVGVMESISDAGSKAGCQ